jgi:hypothetical protein
MVIAETRMRSRKRDGWEQTPELENMWLNLTNVQYLDSLLWIFAISFKDICMDIYN